MSRPGRTARLTRGAAVLTGLLLAAGCTGEGRIPADQDAAPDPMVFETWTPGPCSATGGAHGGCDPGELVRIRVVPVVEGLVRPWHLTFMPDGRMLISELPGRLRLARAGVPEAGVVDGWPVEALEPRTLHSVLIHPDFAQNGLVYLSYEKGREDGLTTMALARGRLDGASLRDVADLFVADAWGNGAIAGRAEFGPDGMVYLTVGDRDSLVFTDDDAARIRAQDLQSHVGKVLRLRDDGTAPDDNPFAGRRDARPEIYTYGHRNVQGLAWHPDTGALWATEIGPMGGDELNVLVPGRNYGWPLVSFGRMYTGNTVSEQSYWRPDIEMPVMFWVPAISPSSVTFYTGDRFPLWRGHLFIGALSGQQIQRVAFGQPMPQQERREPLLVQLDIRFRDVRQGPDGYLYAATEKTGQDGPGSAQESPDGMIIRIEPAPAS